VHYRATFANRSERGQPGRHPSGKDAANPADKREVIPMTKHPGIAERRDSTGRVRYLVRVRRNGMSLTATLPTLAEALSWRSRALDAAEGLATVPESPRASPPVAAALTRVVTIADASRRICRGMLDGTVRTNRGEPYKPSATRKYEAALRLDVLPRIGAVPVATLSTGDVQRLVDEVAAAESVVRARKALIALRVLEHNPCAGVKAPAGNGGERPARVLTAAECDALVLAAEVDDVTRRRSFAAPLVTLALATGLREGELLALAWGSDGLDVDAGLVRVRRSLDRHRDGSGSYPLVQPKSRASRRDVPLPPDAVERLRRHRHDSGSPPEGALVFAEADGFPVAAHGKPRAAWRRIVKAAGIAEPLPRFHDLRHAYATHLLAAGLTAHAVAELLGHSDAGLVWRRYGHALPAEVASAGDVLAGWRRENGASLAQD
jgi:integrase